MDTGADGGGGGGDSLLYPFALLFCGTMVMDMVPSGSWSSNWGPELVRSWRRSEGVVGEGWMAWREMDG